MWERGSVWRNVLIRRLFTARSSVGDERNDWRMTHVPMAADAVTRVRLWKAESWKSVLPDAESVTGITLGGGITCLKSIMT